MYDAQERAAAVPRWPAEEGEWNRAATPAAAQVVPLVHAVRKGLRLASVAVAFEAPAAMKAQEEGDVGFIEKRLAQLNSLDPLVKAAWTDSPYC